MSAELLSDKPQRGTLTASWVWDMFVHDERRPHIAHGIFRLQEHWVIKQTTDDPFGNAYCILKNVVEFIPDEPVSPLPHENELVSGYPNTAAVPAYTDNLQKGQ